MRNLISLFKSKGAKRAATNTAWLLIGQIVGRGSSFFAGLVCARILEVNDFGRFGMVRSTIGVFGVLAGLGLGATATVNVAKLRNSDPKGSGEIIGFCRRLALFLGVIMAFTVFFSAPFLASFFLLDKDLDSALMIGSIILLLSSQAGVEEGCLAGLEGFSAIAKASAVDGITVLAAMIPMTYLWGVNGAIGALIISSALRLMVLRYHVGRRCDHFGLTVSSKDFKKNLSLLMSYSIPAFLCGFMYGPAIWIFNRIVISQPDGYNMLGLISAADQWKTMILFVPGAVVVVVLPMLSNEKNRNAKRYDKIIRINILVASAIALAAALPVALFGSQIETIYGLSFKGLSAVLVIGAATAVFHSIGGAAGSAIMTNDNIWPNFLINLIWAACLIAGCYFLAGRYGVLGAAYSYLIAQVIHSVILMPYALTGKAKGVA